MLAKSKKTLRLEKASEKRDFEEKRILEILKLSGGYSAALHPLIETYLDAFEIYYVMYDEWKSIGFKPTKAHTNKAGARNETKHPIAQQVESWSQKKAKYLNQLGLDSKNKKMINVGQLLNETKKDEKEETPVSENKLLAFKKKVGKG